MTTPYHNSVSWFEIPVTDMARAVTFYETVLAIRLERHTMGILDMAWFPRTDGASGAAGSLVYHATWYAPSRDGVLLYFTAPSGDLRNELSRVEAAGGQVLMPRKEVGAFGATAIILDSEGNRIALHSKP